MKQWCQDDQPGCIANPPEPPESKEGRVAGQDKRIDAGTTHSGNGRGYEKHRDQKDTEVFGFMPVHFLTQNITYENGGQQAFGDVNGGKKKGLSDGKYSNIRDHFCGQDRQ